MKGELQEYEATIQKKHSISWTPKFKEEFRTHLNEKTFVAIAVKTIEQLAWDQVHQDELSVEAKRKGNWEKWTEKITVTFDHGKIEVISVSLGSEIWDYGRNSKRVRLFIYAFQQIANKFDKDDLIELERESERNQNWENYVIPQSLTQPKEPQLPIIWIPIAGGVISSILFGALIAFLTLKGLYIIMLFEFLVAIGIVYSLKHFIKLGNYTTYKHLNFLLLGMVLLTYFSNQYIQYQFILFESELPHFSFWEFMQTRFVAGLKFEDIDTGWIGLIACWIIQIVVTFFVGILLLIRTLFSYQIERVPMEVVNFAYYHFIKDKTEQQVRAELFKMGWIHNQSQNEVFEAIGAIHGTTQMNR